MTVAAVPPPGGWSRCRPSVPRPAHGVGLGIGRACGRGCLLQDRAGTEGGRT